MSVPLRALIVEDAADDALLLACKLERGGYEVDFRRVGTPQAMEAALEEEPWDVVLSDHRMPLFSAAGALTLLRRKGLDLPFVVVSGEIGEDEAVALMRAGAHDYVPKSGLARLVPAVQRELREAENRREKRRAEEALREAEGKYRSIFENAPEGVFQTTPEGRLLVVNPTMARLLGYDSPEEMVSRVTDVASLLYADPSHREEFIARIRRGGAVSRLEAPFVRKDGGTVWISVSARAISGPDGEFVGLEGTVEDITERKRTEEYLKESEESLRATFDQAAVGMAQVGLDGRWLKVNRKLCDIVGYTSEELLKRTFQDITHPEDLYEDLGYVRQMLSGEIETYSMEKRYVKKDDSIAWACLTVSLARGSDLDSGPVMGEPRHFVAVVEDVTERKRTEEALRQSEGLHRAVVEQAAEGIFLVDAESLNVVEANATLHRSLGYAPEELLRMTLYDIAADDREAVDLDVRRAMKGGVSGGERRYRRKDGAPIDFEVSTSAIRYGGREALCVVAHDVTERKQAEEDLRRSLGVLLALQEAGQVLGSTLESEEVVSRLLGIMHRVSNLTAAAISVPDDDGRIRIWRSVGLDELWPRARFVPKAEDARLTALNTEEQCLFTLEQAGDGAGLAEDRFLVGLCIPLRTRDRVVGVLEAYGPGSLAEDDASELLGSLASQAASALENALLYGELEEREHRLQDLVGKLLRAQEEERRRVAYEVHDGLTQVAAAAHQHLQAFARRHLPNEEKGRRDLDRILRLVRQTVSESRRIIANLRPTALDDFGLAAAVSLEVERLREEGYRVEYEEGLGEERLPTAVEIALFRVAQEALANVRKHAQTLSVRVELRRPEGGNEVCLEVRDRGRGFDPSAALGGSGPGERIGLAGMRERVGMLGGELEVRSRYGAGTAVAVVVPVPEAEGKGNASWKVEHGR